MQRNDWGVAAFTAIMLGIGSITAFAPGGDPYFRVAVLSFLALNVVLQVWFYRKSEKQVAHDQKQLITLLDSLHQPLSDLHPRFPLPPMRVSGNWTATPDFAQVLMRLIKEHRPQSIVELGSGVSSLICGYTVEKNGEGRVVSLDHEKQYAQQSNDLVTSHALQDFVQVRHAPLREYSLSGEKWRWYDDSTVQDVSEIDLLIVDGPPAVDRPCARYPALPLLISKLSSRAIIVLDDGIRSDEREIVRRWLREHPGFQSEYVSTEKGTFILRRI